MSQKRFSFQMIGVIRSAHTEAARTPIQPAFAEGCLGRAELLPEFAEGLKDREGAIVVQRLAA